MKPRKVNIPLEATTDLSLGVIGKTRKAVLFDKTGALIGEVPVQQAKPYVVQPIPNAKPPKKGASKK